MMVGPDGNAQVDDAGEVMWEDNRLSGRQYRTRFFKGAGIVDHSCLVG
jgi:hypothetical protein